MHQVLRTFTAGRGRVRVGNVVDGSNYRNLSFLMRKGYLVDVGEAELTPVDEIGEVPETEALPRPLSKKTSKKLLLAEAERLGVEIPEGATNQAIVDAITEFEAQTEVEASDEVTVDGKEMAADLVDNANIIDQIAGSSSVS